MIIEDASANRTALLITAIARPALLVRCIASWCDALPRDEFAILIAEQGEKTKNALAALGPWGGEWEHYTLPHDCGLSASRNYLVEKARERGLKRFVLGADSLHAGPETARLSVALGLLHDYDIVGLDQTGRPPYTYRMEIRGDKLFMLPAPPVDCIHNFFAARTESIKRVPWDPDLKMFEHEDFFLRARDAKLKIGESGVIAGKYILSRNATYEQLRVHNMVAGRRRFATKYGLSKGRPIIRPE